MAPNQRGQMSMRDLFKRLWPALLLISLVFPPVVSLLGSFFSSVIILSALALILYIALYDPWQTLLVCIGLALFVLIMLFFVYVSTRFGSAAGVVALAVAFFAASSVTTPVSKWIDIQRKR